MRLKSRDESCSMASGSVCAEIHRKMSNHEKEMHGVIVLERNQRALLLLLFGYLVAAAVVAVASFFSFLFVVEQRGIAEA